MEPEEPKFTPSEELQPLSVIHHLAGWEVTVTAPKGVYDWGVQHMFLDIAVGPEHGLVFPTHVTLECGVEDNA